MYTQFIAAPAAAGATLAVRSSMDELPGRLREAPCRYTHDPTRRAYHITVSQELYYRHLDDIASGVPTDALFTPVTGPSILLACQLLRPDAVNRDPVIVWGFEKPTA